MSKVCFFCIHGNELVRLIISSPVIFSLPCSCNADERIARYATVTLWLNSIKEKDDLMTSLPPFSYSQTAAVMILSPVWISFAVFHTIPFVKYIVEHGPFFALLLLPDGVCLPLDGHVIICVAQTKLNHYQHSSHDNIVYIIHLLSLVPEHDVCFS